MISPDDVCACLVTRGDVNMTPILESLPYGQVIVWDNSKREQDLKVYGRYAAISESEKPIIYFQDDDCIVTCHDKLMAAYEPGLVVGNMLNSDPARLHYYRDTTLLGWGSLFDWSLPFIAFDKYERYYEIDDDFKFGLGAETVFPMLSRTRTIIEGIEWIYEGSPVYERSNRMWKQPDFYSKRDLWMARAREVRDRG